MDQRPSGPRDQVPTVPVGRKCLYPIFGDGVRLTFSAADPLKAGDFVCLWLKPRFYHERIKYQCMVKRLVTPLPTGPFPLPDEMPAPPIVLVEMLNPRRTFAVPLNRVMAVHNCRGEYEGEQLPKLSREQARELAEAQRAAAGR